MVCSSAAMPTSAKVIWLSSAKPDSAESDLLASLPQQEVSLAQSSEDLAKLCRSIKDAVVFANFSERETALECVELLRRENESIPILVRDRYSTVAEALPIAQLGPTRIFDGHADCGTILAELQIALEDAASLHRKRLQVQDNKPAWQTNIIGESDAMLQICEVVRLVASRRSTVLISGETGTGKEVIARALHQASPRGALPMVAVNCSAIPANLLEAELFGYVRGAFTGAQQMRTGRFEQAHKSTLFLDEIGDMSLSAQAKVLRALQENIITRVGADKDIKVDVRVIAATNKDLKKEIAEGRFREDLYHRLAVILINVPSLNERRDDIPLLISHFAEKIASEQGNAVKHFSAAAVKLLQEYDWTGNIRELRNVVERLIILGGNEISESDVQLFASK